MTLHMKRLTGVRLVEPVQRFTRFLAVSIFFICLSEVLLMDFQKSSSEFSLFLCLSCKPS